MAKMEYNRKDRVRLKADFLRWILACPIDPARQSLLVEFVETYVALADHEQAEFQQFVRNDPEYTQVQQMITTYEQKGIAEGKQKGIEEGKQKGIEEGKQEALILVLEKKFGKLGDAQKQRIRQVTSTPELESLLLAALDAVSLEDLPL
jgi:flagellar biosynthesis/type III secretory pathway protein FliH